MSRDLLDCHGQPAHWHSLPLPEAVAGWHAQHVRAFHDVISSTSDVAQLWEVSISGQFSGTV